MAKNVILSVQLNGAEAALAQLTQLDNVVNRLKANRNVNIKVSASGITSAANQAAKLDTNLTNAGKAAQQIGTTGAQSIGNAGTALTKASRNAESFRNGLGNVIGTMIKFRLITSAINLASGALKSAFEEMVSVDSELVNIRKATGYTNEEIERLSRNAYGLATRYGRTASEVLEASTVFARAGYTEQIEQLSELSLLLQNVGDLNAEDASKFLIATDKAYKLGGSYEELMAIIDGLDNITNKNATDMQKMTEGMTVAGSVFAESGESVEVFAALLGTATAATQRSGSEVARGLRTIWMNIRQIRGETEDGELIDGESWAAAAKALRDYAGISTMENGQLRKGSDVLAELAEKWDTLTETQRAAVSEAVAGKRQANILMALMGDWESYEKMLGEYENAAGTAAAENEIYMESWEAKTAQLSAAWQGFISSLANLELPKEFIEGLTSFFEDVTDLINGDDGLVASEQDYYEKLRLAVREYDTLLEKGDALTEQERARVDYLQRRIQYLEKISGFTAQDARGVNTGLDFLSDNWLEIGARLLFGNEATDRLKRLLLEEDKNVQEEISQILSDATNNFLVDFDAENYANRIEAITDAYGEYVHGLEEAKAAGEVLTEEQERQIEVYNTLRMALELLNDQSTIYEGLAMVIAAKYESEGHSFGASYEAARQDLANFGIEIGELPETIEVEVETPGADEAQNELEEINALSEDKTKTVTVKVEGDSLPGYASGTEYATGGISLVNEKGPELISANGIAWIAGGGKPTLTMLPKGATVLTSDQTKNALRNKGIPAYKDGALGDEWPDFFYGFEPSESSDVNKSVMGVIDGIFFRPVKNSGSRDAEIVNEFGGTWRDDHDWEELERLYGGNKKPDSKAQNGEKNNLANGGGAGGGGESGPTPPNFKALEDDLTKLLKNLDAQAKLAENEEDFLKAMMVYGDAQSAIAELLEQYRANGYAEDSDEVLRLANLGYDYAAKQLGGYDKLQQSLIDALNGLTKATDDANELQERREAVEKAREALQNAERQRTVRIFNPITGQWEWVANAADVQKAQEKLQSAEQALRKEELSQAVDAIKNASPADLGSMTLSPAILEALFGGTPEQQTAFLNALGAATGGANWLSSSEAQTPWNQGNSIGTQYNLNGITLTEAQASGMTIKDLIAMLQGLKIT